MALKPYLPYKTQIKSTLNYLYAELETMDFRRAKIHNQIIDLNKYLRSNIDKVNFHNFINQPIK